jgi:hypothetical protein
MTLDQIRSFLHGTEPFTIRMMSGREYRVPHPDYAGLSQDHANLFFTHPKGGFEVIRLSQLESINLDKAPTG